MAEKRKQDENLAAGQDHVRFAASKAQLAAALQKLSALGISGDGAAGLLTIMSDGMTGAELAAVQDAVSLADRAVEGQIVAAKGSKALLAAMGVSGGEAVSRGEGSYESGLGSLLNPLKIMEKLTEDKGYTA